MSVFGFFGETPEEKAKRIVHAEAAKHRVKVLQRERDGAPKRAGEDKVSARDKRLASE